MYSAPALAQLPWYAVLGNHDYGEGIEQYNASIIAQCMPRSIEQCKGSSQCCHSPVWQLNDLAPGEYNWLATADARWHQQRSYNLSAAGS